jgi:molybdate transport system ATP-binding protein
VRPGEHLALVGANGSGKTTLLRLIAGLYHPAVGGSVERPGLAAPEGLTDLREIRKRIGMVSFELEAEYEKELTGLELVLSGFAASIGLYDTPTEAALATARRWLDSLGVADLADRRLGALSAGQTRRLFLARAMVAKPCLLLLDEPFAGLDTDSRREALATVSTLARTGVTVLAAVHDTGDIIPEIRIIRRLDHGRLLSATPA